VEKYQYMSNNNEIFTGKKKNMIIKNIMIMRIIKVMKLLN